MSYKAKIYIVHVEEENGETKIRVERNDGQWYDENYNEIAQGTAFADISHAIENDFNRATKAKQHG